ncbi:hypothetical protein [Streptomyces sp. cmx-18-6]|uniref:hypothetical protein n=1 Tax=Streptomyces sp. cmx-18-6 TaxID=2790930 RepID=UPI0039815240
MTRRTRREKSEIAAVWAVAGAVHALAVLCAALRGPGALLWFLPALLGSLLAVWCVRRGVLVAVRSRASARTDMPARASARTDLPARAACRTDTSARAAARTDTSAPAPGDNRACDQGAGGRRP